MSSLLHKARSSDLLSAIDTQAASALGRLAGERDEFVLVGAAMASRAVRQGHVCASLEASAALLEHDDIGPMPGAQAWALALRGSPLTNSGPASPLVLDGAGRLYLRRFWELEQELAGHVRARLAAPDCPIDDDLARAGLRSYFHPCEDDIDWQRVAACVALLRPLSIVTGGPGTGKTSTVAALLAMVVEQALQSDGKPPRIALMAPTGKAAARLQESIAEAARKFDITVPVHRAMSVRASTIHRFLGPAWRPTAHDGLDCVLVDESSMVDLGLMTRLLRALPPTTRLVLLGDRHQLTSVDAGSVLGDLCRAGGAGRSSTFASRVSALMGGNVPGGGAAGEGGTDHRGGAGRGDGGESGQVPGEGDAGIGDAIVELRRSWRYADESGVGVLARAVNRGDAAAALAVLHDPAYPDATFVTDPWPDELQSMAVEALAPGGDQLGREGLLIATSRFRVLCAVRSGRHGSGRVNELIGRAVHGAAPSGAAVTPFMVTRNDRTLDVFNGDLGATDENGAALLQCPDESYRSLALSVLPGWEPSWAMTIHRSQGSEFDTVVAVLPPPPSRALTRELLYTAVTRAKTAVRIIGTEASVTEAIEQRVRRDSGLADALV